VAKFLKETEKNTIIVTGNLDGVEHCKYFTLQGYWREHRKFGRQFRITQAIPDVPKDLKALQKLFCTPYFKGIGPKTVQKLITQFGQKIFEILNNRPENLYLAKQIRRTALRKIIDYWQQLGEVRDVYLFLYKHDIVGKSAKKIYLFYKKYTLDIIKKDPYRLIFDIGGISFLTADKIATSLNFPRDHIKRLEAAVHYVLKLAEEEGHCFLTEEQIEQKLQQLLNFNSHERTVKFLNIIQELINKNFLIKTKHPTKNKFLYMKMDLYIAEKEVTQKLRELTKNLLSVETLKIQEWFEQQKKEEVFRFPLSSEQRDAVLGAAKHPVLILTGGPGVGKTTTLKAMILMFQYFGRHVTLCAPTGRAAQRLHEITHTSAKTIHRLLEWLPDKRCFNRNETSPLTTDIIIIDEFSMVDIKLLQKILLATPDRCQVIFVGDSDQLPSVGPGQCLLDLLHSGKIPVIRLRKIFRQAAESNIIRFAHEINRGKMPVFPLQSSDCRLLPYTESNVIKVIDHLVKIKIPRKYPKLSSKDIQILTPMKKGELGTISLNLYLQKSLNPLSGKKEHACQIGSQEFYLQDKVIQTSNNYELGIFNGDIGYIHQINHSKRQIYVKFHDKSVSIDWNQAGDLNLAYAITIHKSQGSEFPIVILPLSLGHYRLLERNLIYTGLTRAKKLALFIGNLRALKIAIQKHSTQKRQTLLEEAVRDTLL